MFVTVNLFSLCHLCPSLEWGHVSAFRRSGISEHSLLGCSCSTWKSLLQSVFNKILIGRELEPIPLLSRLCLICMWTSFKGFRAVFQVVYSLVHKAFFWEQEVKFPQAEEGF